ncbi:MAG: PAS domain S-box protein [Ignavibacteriaceae bacterium]|nr:PAS domain S-box protein [Ignavibacteriaceae bacterium]
MPQSDKKIIKNVENQQTVAVFDFPGSQGSIVNMFPNGAALLSVVKDEEGNIHDFNFDDINEAGCKLLSIPFEKIRNKSLLSHFPFLFEIDVFDGFCSAVQTGNCVEFKGVNFNYFTAPVDYKKVLDLKATRYYSGLLITLSSNSNISYQTKEHLKKIELLNGILKSPPNIFYIFNLLENRITFASGNSETLTGYTAKELEDIGSGFIYSIIHPEDFPKSILHFRQIMNGNDDTFYECSFRILQKQGSYQWFKSKDKAFERDSSGNVVSFLGLLDVDENRVNLSPELIEREILLSKIFESSLDGFFIIDAYTGLIQDCNDAAVKMFEFSSRNDFKGKAITDFYFESPSESKSRYFMQQKLQESGQCSGEFELIRGNETFWGSVSCSGFTTGSKKFFFVAIKDITDSKVYEENLEKFAIELKNNIAIRDHFMKLAAHDIKSPLNGIIGYIDLLKEDFDSFSLAEVKDFTEKIGFSLHHLYTFVCNLLEWTSLQSGTWRFQKELFDLTSLIENVISLLDWKLKSKSIQIICNIPPECFIVSDLNALKSIIANLLTNAIKFSYKNSTIEVNLEHSDQSCILVIKDFGCGISSGNLSRILDKKDQFTTLGTDSEKGTGLGINFVLLMSEKLGINVNIDSTINSGTTITLRIPAQNKV